MADIGYATYRLTDDWNGTDFLAVHFDGTHMLRVQLKSRLAFEHKYRGKDLWVCFRRGDLVYLYPHDDLMKAALKVTKIATTESWEKTNGGYSFPSPPKALQKLLDRYCLNHRDVLEL